ncbi:MAG: sel1 repeat family protein [Desulfovibrio sp.]|nr:sel1 repeat family protein [Desulfovibrio sp.]
MYFFETFLLPYFSMHTPFSSFIRFLCVWLSLSLPILICPFFPREAEGAGPAPASSEKKTVDEAADAYKKGDFARARLLWEKQAEKGDAYAMNNLGILYDRGQGVSIDLGRALHWFALSAKAGNPQGMSNYGWMLDQGRGIAANPEEAARWYDKSARAGQREAQYNLGLMYERGRGVPRDMVSAAAWYSRAAEQHQTEGLARLGHLYRVGEGVPKDSAKATLLLYAATMNGSKRAIAELAEMAPADSSQRGIALFGQRMDQTDRTLMREVLATTKVPPLRVDDAFICDLYDVSKTVPGAGQMTICYGSGKPEPLGFLKIDYKAPSKAVASQIHSMVAGRFGKPSASESDASSLWNMGSVVIATQYMPEQKQMSLMYMVPQVYHQTKMRKEP